MGYNDRNPAQLWRRARKKADGPTTAPAVHQNGIYGTVGNGLLNADSRGLDDRREPSDFRLDQRSKVIPSALRFGWNFSANVG